MNKKGFILPLAIMVGAAVIVAFFVYFSLNNNDKEENIVEKNDDAISVILRKDAELVDYEDIITLYVGEVKQIRNTNTVFQLDKLYYKSEDAGEYAGNPILRADLLVEGDEGARVIEMGSGFYYPKIDYIEARFVVAALNEDFLKIQLQKIWKTSEEYTCFNHPFSGEKNYLNCRGYESAVTKRNCNLDYIAWAESNCPDLEIVYEAGELGTSVEEKTCVGYDDMHGLPDYELGQNLNLPEFVETIEEPIEIVATYFDYLDYYHWTLEEWNDNVADLEARGLCPENPWCVRLEEGKIGVIDVLNGKSFIALEGRVYWLRDEQISLAEKISDDFYLFLEIKDYKEEDGSVITIYRVSTYGGCDLSKSEIMYKFEDFFEKINLPIPETLKEVPLLKTDQVPRYYKDGALVPMPQISESFGEVTYEENE